MLGLRPGQPAAISQTAITIGATAFVLDACDLWRPGAWPRVASPAALIETHDAIAHRAATEAPDEGLGRAIAGTCDTRLARVARIRIARFEAWLADTIELDGVSPLPVPVRDLVGLGPGLTPSGDDFLIGALALLDAIGEGQAHVRLARALRQVPPGLTSPLSRAFLRAAAAGHVGEKLRAALSAIIAGDADAAIAAIRDVGHSSGWDVMAGAMTALAASCAANRPRALTNH